MTTNLNLFLSVLPLVVLIAAIVVIRIGIRRFFHRRRRQQPTNLCRCGYPLDNLSLARCPECGRVFGFDATAEDLGLSTEQLQRAQTAREQRKIKNP